ncbi:MULTISPECIES: ribonuclease P protein component [unclassified Romboutsia]|uniref:ribonuclease P protein component n=1 Tax=unclassified Romboutsia TaxID=2626894 RepID=UPI0008211E3E|nr:MULTISPECIES: ribonuclease P protein component [unclassified Romboutsia]SCI28863.1 Ribonuclease P protein component [uncultured Clostridium sp.]
MDFNRTQGLKKDSDFRKVYKHGKSFANRYLVMYILKNKSENSRIGISVSKKVGKAIVRNKVRRRIKESYRLNIDENVKSGYDIVFIARVAIKDANYDEIEKSMKHLIRKSEMYI